MWSCTQKSKTSLSKVKSKIKVAVVLQQHLSASSEAVDLYELYMYAK